MADRFAKGYDPHQQGLLLTLYGDLVPQIQMLLVRPGHHRIVDRMFAELGRLPDRRSLRVVRVESRNAGWLEIVRTGSALGSGDIIADAEEAVRSTCEHCGKPARIVLKVGLESRMSSPELELGDRLLCMDCSDNFRRENGL